MRRRRKWQPTPLSCLENPRDGRAWWAAVCGVTQSRTWLKWLSISNSSICPAVSEVLGVEANRTWEKGRLGGEAAGEAEQSPSDIWGNWGSELCSARASHSVTSCRARTTEVEVRSADSLTGWGPAPEHSVLLSEVPGAGCGGGVGSSGVSVCTS